jgi:hypothetical protein
VDEPLSLNPSGENNPNDKQNILNKMEHSQEGVPRLRGTNQKYKDEETPVRDD